MSETHEDRVIKYAGAGAALLGAVSFNRVKVPENPNMHNRDQEWAKNASHYFVTMQPNLRPCGLMNFYYSMGIAHTEPPTDKDLALCLCHIALDGGSSIRFEDWADEFGYDKDSRSAEKTYNLCVQQARDLAAVFPKPLEWWDQALEEFAGLAISHAFAALHSGNTQSGWASVS